MNSKLQNSVLIAIMVAIMIVLGLIPAIPIGVVAVPILLQNIGVMLTAIILGPKDGTIAIFTFLLLVAFGFPFLSGGRGGLAVFVSPTFGYLVGYLLMPTIMWGLTRLVRQFKVSWLTWLMLWISTLVVDIIGSIGLVIQSHLPIKQALLVNLTFIPGDTLKLIVAIIVVDRLSKRLTLTDRLL